MQLVELALLIRQLQRIQARSLELSEHTPSLIEGLPCVKWWTNHMTFITISISVLVLAPRISHGYTSFREEGYSSEHDQLH